MKQPEPWPQEVWFVQQKHAEAHSFKENSSSFASLLALVDCWPPQATGHFECGRQQPVKDDKHDDGIEFSSLCKPLRASAARSRPLKGQDSGCLIVWNLERFI
jgi:hypothetical protein